MVFGAPLSIGAAREVAKPWPKSWQDADWSSAGLLPAPNAHKEAHVAVLAARTARWKGLFSQHCWIVIKPKGHARYERYEVVGWGDPVRKDAYAADGRWFSNQPTVVYEISGHAAAKIIPTLRHAIDTYTHNAPETYRMWPGPNSNTFVATMARQIVGFDPHLPANAIGKDYLREGTYFGPTPTNSGWQVSLGGFLGVTLARREGFEINLFGLVVGANVSPATLSLPSLGTMRLDGEP